MREREEPKVTSGFLALATVDVSPLREEMEERVGFGRKKASSTRGGGSWKPLGYTAVHAMKYGTRQPMDNG